MVFDRMIIYRDVLFYIVATLLVIYFAYQKQITWVSSLMLLGLYVALVIFVVIRDQNVEASVKQ